MLPVFQKRSKKQKTYIPCLPRRRHMKKREKPKFRPIAKTRAKSGKASGNPKVQPRVKITARSGMKKTARSMRPRTPSKPARKSDARSKKRASVSVKTRRTSSKTGSLFMEPLEQVTVMCSTCNRKFSIVKIPNLKTEGMICQRCSVGEIQFPD